MAFFAWANYVCHCISKLQWCPKERAQTGTNHLGDFLLSEVAGENLVSVLTNSFEGIRPQKLFTNAVLNSTSKDRGGEVASLECAQNWDLLSEIITKSWWRWQFLSLTFRFSGVFRNAFGRHHAASCRKKRDCVAKDNRKENYTRGCGACGPRKVPLCIAPWLL